VVKWYSFMCVKYKSLFDLSNNKLSTVVVMCELGWEEGEVAWQWHRQLWAWKEDMLEECMSLLYDISLQSDISDQWLWMHDLCDGYSVRGSYNLITSQDSHVVEATSDLI